ncbi:MAG: MFS transporter [Aggregatilineales bacterium]
MTASGPFTAAVTVLAQRSIPFLITLNVTTLGLTLWSSVTNPNLYQYKLQLLVDHTEVNTWLGLVSIGGLVVATIAQPAIGVLSDRTRGRFGRRAPYLLMGMIGVVLALIAIAAAPSLGTLIVAILFGQVASNAIQGPWQALSPDQVPDGQKGAAAGVKTVFELLGLISSGFIVQALLAHGNVTATVILLGAVSVISTSITVFSTPDVPLTERPPQTLNLAGTRRSIADRWQQLTPDTRRNLTWWLVNRFLFWAGVIAVRQFIINYMQDVGHYSESDALGISGQFTILLGIGVILITLPAGLLSDRVGRVRLIVASSVVACAGALVLIFARQPEPLYAVALLAGAGAGMYFSVNWALVTVLVPAAEAALFLGIANAATTLGSVTGQLGGSLVDTVNRLTGTVNGYFVLFGLAALFFLLSAVAISRVRETSTHQLSGTQHSRATQGF